MTHAAYMLIYGQLDKIQRRMIRLSLNVRPLVGETEDAFFRWSARVISNVQKDCGCWSWGWAERCITWAAHIIRNNCNCAWGNSILDVRSTREIDLLRSQQTNRPGTRCQAGFMCRRWTDSVPFALAFLRKDAGKSIRYSLCDANASLLEARRQRVKIHLDYVEQHIHRI